MQKMQKTQKREKGNFMCQPRFALFMNNPFLSSQQLHQELPYRTLLTVGLTF
jgi:hypothetical protein